MPGHKYVIEPLDASKHDRSAFKNEEPAMEQYIKTKARKYMQANAASCFVIAEQSNPSQILGFYTLSYSSVALERVPGALAKQLKLPKYPRIPVTLLGRIARDLSARSQPIGKLLISDAIKRAVRSSKEIGSVGIILDPKNCKLADYYAKYGLKPLSNAQMLLPMKDAASFLEQRYRI